MESETKTCNCTPAEDEHWEVQEQNQELRKITSKGDKKVEMVKKSDIVNKKKYQHIEQSISLIDKLRIALREISDVAN